MAGPIGDGKLNTRNIGQTVEKSDNARQWLRAQLDLIDEYERMVYQMAIEGKLGWSSGASSHRDEKIGKAVKERK